MEAESRSKVLKPLRGVFHNGKNRVEGDFGSEKGEFLFYRARDDTYEKVLIE